VFIVYSILYTQYSVVCMCGYIVLIVGVYYCVNLDLFVEAKREAATNH
jgi:hypothetical protein